MSKEHQYHPTSRPHPGETLAEKLKEMLMGPKEFALRTGKPEKTIIAILKGQSAITPDMSVKFEQVTKIPAHFWMNHQRSYDEYIARLKQKVMIDSSVTWAKQFPLADMIKKGWLTPSSSIEEKTMSILSFFGFAHYTAWEEYYLNQQLKVAFRISLAHTKDPYALSAWLRQGELQAATLEAKNYTDKNFKEILPQLKSIMTNTSTNYFEKLQRLCLNAGVKVVLTPGISKAPISGSARWVNNTPLIQLSDKFRRQNNWWFTFFHEVGHILLHGKKDIFLENLDYSDKDMLKEKEADDFANFWIN